MQVVAMARSSTVTIGSSVQEGVGDIANSFDAALASSTDLLPPAFRMMINWEAESFCEQRRLEGTLTTRNRLYRFLVSPASSRGGYWFSFFILIVSIVSVFTAGVEAQLSSGALNLVVQASGGYASFEQGLYKELKERAYNGTLDDQFIEQWNLSDHKLSNGWEILNVLYLLVFSSELIMRIISYPNFSAFSDIMIWVDIGCIVPLVIRIWVATSKYFVFGFLLEIYFVYDRPVAVMLTVITALSSLRFLKMTRYFISTSILIQAFKDSSTALIVPAYLLLMLVVFFGSILFAVEYDPDGGSVPDITTSWWMLIVTMTTVGYGDYSPSSTAGRIIISVAIFGGLCLSAMPLAIVGSNFSNAWDRRLIVLVREKLRYKMLKEGASITDVFYGFRIMGAKPGLGRL